MANIVKYKDYQGSVVFSAGKLIIKILHIDDTIVEECDSASEVEAAFAALVEDYLETCQLVGKAPCKPFKGGFNVRVTPSLHRRAAMAAIENGLSLNAWVEDAMEKHLSDSRSLVTLRALRNALRDDSGFERYDTLLTSRRAMIVGSPRIGAPGLVMRQFKQADLASTKAIGNG